jgi:hypothetical protein
MATYNIRGPVAGTNAPGFTVIKFLNSSPISISDYDSFITNKGTVTAIDPTGTRVRYRPGSTTNQTTQFFPGATYEIISWNSFTITTDTDEEPLDYQERIPILSGTQIYDMPSFCFGIPISSYNAALGPTGYIRKIVFPSSGQSTWTRGYTVATNNAGTNLFVNFEPDAEYEIKSDRPFDLINNCSNTPTPTPTNTPTTTPTPTVTPTKPPTPTPTNTPTNTPTVTPTKPPTPTPTNTPTNTPTVTRTSGSTPTPTPTQTSTPTRTQPPTSTPTPTQTGTPPVTPSKTPAPTRTPSPTTTPTPTPTTTQPIGIPWPSTTYKNDWTAASVSNTGDKIIIVGFTSIAISVDYGVTWYQRSQIVGGNTTTNLQNVACAGNDPDKCVVVGLNANAGVVTSSNFMRGYTIPSPPQGSQGWNGTGSLESSWYACAISDDGSKIYASSFGSGLLWRSLNGGVTWSSVNIGYDLTLPPNINEYYDVFRHFDDIACSSDGAKLIASSGGSGIEKRLFVSTDSGATWSVKEVARQGGWVAVCCSSDGSVMYAGTKKGTSTNYGKLYKSTNSGNTWTEVRTVGNVTDVACSSDGQTVVVANKYDISTTDSSKGGLFMSTNGGSSWSTTANGDLKDWRCVAMNSSGSVIVAGHHDNPYGTVNRLYVSTNSGATWTKPV